MSSPPTQGLLHYYDTKNENEQIWDDRHFPIMTLRTNGVPTIDLMERAYSLRNPLLEYAKANGLHAVLISDLSLFKTPDAVTRKTLSKYVAENDSPFKGTLLGTVFIVTNPLMRGVITAVSWVAGDAMVPSLYVASIPDALKQIRKLYGNINQEMPPFPENYEFDEVTI